MRHTRIYMVPPIWLRPWACIEGFYKVMWELQHLSTNKITTKIYLLLGENTSLISHKYLIILWDYFPFLTLLFFSLVVHFKAWMHCLFINKHPCLCLAKDKWHRIGAASGIELVRAHIVDLGSTNWCPSNFT